MKNIILTFLILLIVSCGKDKDLLSELINVDYYLTRGECDKAREVLEEMGPSLNARYIGARSNVEACYAGFSELEDLFSGNLENIDPNSFQTILKSFASFGTPEILDAEEERYLKLREAIDLILFSDGENEPSAQNRKLIFGIKASTDLNMQALYMLMYQFSSYLKTYGNTNPFGEKGEGTFGNNCFLNYTDPFVIGMMSPSLTGSCTQNGEGSSFLDFITIPDEAIRRSCEGIVILNNIIDILKNINIPQSHAGELEEMLQKIEDYFDYAASYDPSIIPYFSVRSNISCESEFSVNQVGFERAYFAIFETGLL